MELAVLGDVDGLARGDVADQRKAQGVKRNALRGDHVLGPAVLILSASEYQRADAVGVAEGDKPCADDEGNNGIGAVRLGVHCPYGLEDVLGSRGQVRSAAELMGKEVDKDLAVAAGVEVPAAVLLDVLGELADISEVAVVGKRNAERRVDIERLGLCGARGAGGRIADVGNADVALKAVHVADLENILYKTVCLSLPELSV